MHKKSFQIFCNGVGHTPLPTVYDFSGYEVALSYFHIPAKFINTPAGAITFRDDRGKLTLAIRADHFADISSYLIYINTLIGSETISISEFKPDHARVSMNGDRVGLQFSNNISKFLRLPPGTIKSTVESTQPIDFVGRGSFVATCNVVSQSYINESFAQILHIGDLMLVSPSHAPSVYYPTIEGQFDHINIELRDTNLVPMNFLTQSYTFVLHFRPIVHK